MTSDDDELMDFADSEHDSVLREGLQWHILLIDDEPDVHAATQLALKGMVIEGRTLAFTHAYSAAEAQKILQSRGDFAVAIVDVVMEEPDAGLHLVRYIREELNNAALRVILRTGQPGYAPEIETIQKFDINDYKTKAELTRVRLFTTVTIAIRSYAQIHQLHAGRRGLEQILSGMRELSRPSGMRAFAAGVVTQLCALLRVPAEGLVCAVKEAPDAAPVVLAAAGHYTAFIGMPLTSIAEERVKTRLSEILTTHRASYEDGVALYFMGDQNQALAAFVDMSHPMEEVERGLLEVFCSNISVAFKNVQLHNAISEVAFMDDVVNLPNRNGLSEAIRLNRSAHNVLALIDIDSFSDINSLLDDSFGDKVLKVVADRLRSTFSAQVCVSRVGSDIFGLYGPAAELTVKAVSGVFSLPFDMDDATHLRLSASAGWVKEISEHTSTAELLKNAGAALKQAKVFRRGQPVFYRQELARDARDRMRLLNDLRVAFTKEALYLNYQPFFDLQTGRIVGAEALLRWRKEDGSFVPPDRFIAMAEQSGLIVPIGCWVLRTAMRWRAAIAPLVDPSFRIAVNISQVQFREPDFHHQLLEIAAECAVEPHCVELELTESVASGNVAETSEKIQALRQLGYSVALDDFGTGFSSLSLLQKMTVDRLKIDRSFISGENAQANGMVVANTIMALARQLNIKTIAEGIETEDQRSQLAAVGCEEGQGYLCSKPIEEVQFLELLSQQTKNVTDCL